MKVKKYIFRRLVGVESRIKVQTDNHINQSTVAVSGFTSDKTLHEIKQVLVQLQIVVLHINSCFGLINLLTSVSFVSCFFLSSHLIERSLKSAKLWL